MKIPCGYLLSTTAAAFFMTAAQGQFSVSFEEPENYTAGSSVAEQPDSAEAAYRWVFQDIGPQGDFDSLGQVTSAAASDGKHSLVWNADSVNITGARIYLRPDDHLISWGTENIPDVSPEYGGTVYFSFDFMYGNTHADSMTEVLNFQIADGALDMSYKSNGALAYNSGGTEVGVLGSDASTLRTEIGKWVSVSGSLNFADQTYSLSVGGVNQGDSKIAFENETPSLNPAIRLSAGTVINVAQPIHIDKIMMSTTAPEIDEVSVESP